MTDTATPTTNGNGTKKPVVCVLYIPCPSLFPFHTH